MRLSEAIRLGAMLKKQGFSRLHRYDTSCALGAAMDAVGVKRGADLKKVLEIPEYVTECPQCHLPWVSKFYNSSALGVVVHLNDSHKWTRERIADYLDSYYDEPPMPQTVLMTEETELQETAK